MNEAIFFLQIVILTGFAFLAAKLGKGALATCICLQALLANLFVLKQISLFGLNVTASDSFAIGSLLALNLLQEYYGSQEAQKVTWTCFVCLFFFMLVSQLHLLYIPSDYDQSHSAFTAILSATPRLFFASLSVFFIVQQIDIRFFKFLKEMLPSSSFSLRAGIALVVSQLLDTALFSFVGLYGIVESLAEIIVFSFAIKMIVITCSTFTLKLAKV